MNKINMFDTIALTENLPEKQLIKGQVGTIVEEFNGDVFEVEFCDKKGKTLRLTSLHEKFMLVLHFDLEAV